MKQNKTVLFLCVIAAMALTACTAARREVHVKVQPPPGAVIISNVPFYEQEDFQCGPAALATVVNYWYGKKPGRELLPVERIIADIYSPTARGVLGLDLEIYAGKLGFQVRQYRGSIADIKAQVDRGVPLILLVDFGFLAYQVNHFMVSTGYTPEGIIFNSGKKENELITDDELTGIWKKTGFWTLSIEP